MMMISSILFLTLTLCQNVSAFTTTSTATRTLSSPSPFLTTPTRNSIKKISQYHELFRDSKRAQTRTRTRHYMSPSSSSISSYNDKTTFILSFDGTVSNTARSNARLAIDVALKTWPFLTFDLSFVCSPESNSPLPEEEEEDYEGKLDVSWLINKMEALAHITTEGIQKDFESTKMLNCDDVLLARMLIEEQVLDGGRSAGTGKYGSKFHPTSTSSREERRSRGTGSRPLTVGEISANWVDGGCLRDTARVKYNVEGKDPFPIIQGHLLELQSCQPLPTIRPSIIDALTTSITRRREQQLPSPEETQNPIAYILVNHESQASSVYKSLSRVLPVDTRIHIVGDDEDDEGNYDVVIISPNAQMDSNDDETTWDVIENIIEDEIQPHSTVYVVHSSLHSLSQSRYLFGDDSPRFINGIGKSTFGDKIQLSLLLPTWADNVVHSQQISATMDPWMNVLSEEELFELITARIVSSS